MDAHAQRGHITRSKQFGCLAIPGKRRRSDCPRFFVYESIMCNIKPQNYESKNILTYLHVHNEHA